MISDKQSAAAFGSPAAAAPGATSGGIHAATAAAPTPAPRRAGSVAVILVLLALVGGICLATSAFAASDGTLAARVTDADGATYDLPLDVDATLTVTSSAGTNVICVQDGAVHVAHASCPNQDCVCQGEVSKAGQQIVCLPNQLVISIAGEGTGAQTYDVMGS